MNLWDSVQKGLEKASNEAARIAKIQRLRSQADKLGRQITNQEKDLLYKTMHLYTSGQLIQPELIQLCQELINLDGQLRQTQQELQFVQSQAPQTAQQLTQPPAQTSPYTSSGDISAVEYPSYVDPTMPALTPPPPPNYPTTQVQDTLMASLPGTPPPPPPGTGDAQAYPQDKGDTVSHGDGYTVSSQETIIVPEQSQPASDEQVIRCAQCGSPSHPGFLFCQQCGAPLQQIDSSHFPTIRGASTLSHDTPAIEKQAVGTDIAEQGTVRASTTNPVSEQETIQQPAPAEKDKPQPEKD